MFILAEQQLNFMFIFFVKCISILTECLGSDAARKDFGLFIAMPPAACLLLFDCGFVLIMSVHMRTDAVVFFKTTLAVCLKIAGVQTLQKIRLRSSQQLAMLASTAGAKS